MNKIKLIIFFILGMVVASVTLVLANGNLTAGDIVYTPSDTSWNVGYVNEAINGLYSSKVSDNYSTTEKVVGTWTNGKPLYQVTGEGHTPTAINTWQREFSLGSTCHIVKYDGYIGFSSSDVRVNIDGNIAALKTVVNANYANNALVDANGDVIMIATHANYVNVPVVMTFWYTKTTD